MEQYTIEEKVIERAYKKLALDALVIQQGRLAEQKSKQHSHSSFWLILMVSILWNSLMSFYSFSC